MRFCENVRRGLKESPFRKYYKETDGLKMDVGAYAAALKFACDIETTIVIGKPSAEYYKAALKCMNLRAEEVNCWNLYFSTQTISRC